MWESALTDVLHVLAGYHRPWRLVALSQLKYAAVPASYLWLYGSCKDGTAIMRLALSEGRERHSRGTSTGLGSLRVRWSAGASASGSNETVEADELSRLVVCE